MRTGFFVAVVLVALISGFDRLGAQNVAAKPAAQSTAAKAKSQANLNAAFQADFKNRIDNYLEIRKKAGKGAPSFSETKDPAKIKAAEAALAAGIQKLRATAQPGDIFAPEIQKTFRRLLAPERRVKIQGHKGNPEGRCAKSVPLKVNATYPERRCQKSHQPVTQSPLASRRLDARIIAST